MLKLLISLDNLRIESAYRNRGLISIVKTNNKQLLPLTLFCVRYEVNNTFVPICVIWLLPIILIGLRARDGFHLFKMFSQRNHEDCQENLAPGFLLKVCNCRLNSLVLYEHVRWFLQRGLDHRWIKTLYWFFYQQRGDKSRGPRRVNLLLIVLLGDSSVWNEISNFAYLHSIVQIITNL